MIKQSTSVRGTELTLSLSSWPTVCPWLMCWVTRCSAPLKNTLTDACGSWLYTGGTFSSTCSHFLQLGEADIYWELFMFLPKYFCLLYLLLSFAIYKNQQNANMKKYLLFLWKLIGMLWNFPIKASFFFFLKKIAIELGVARQFKTLKKNQKN